MKRLLIITDSFLPRIDGVAKFLDDLIPELKKRFALTVLAPRFPGDPVASSGYSLYTLPVRNIQIGDYQPPKRDVKLVKDLVQKNDIIWTQTLGPLGSLGIDVAEKKKLMAFVHSLEWELFSKGIAKTGFFRRPVESITKVYVRNRYNKCSRLIVPTKHARESLKEIGVKTKMKIINLGVDTSRFKPPKNRSDSKKKIGLPDTKIIGYVGRIGKEKDIPTLVKAFSLIGEGPRLLIVGKGNKTVEAKIKGKNIIRVGAVSDVRPYLNAMDIFVLPSLTETTSLSTMEAMATELPVICTPVGLIKEYLLDKKNGFLFQPGDHKALAGIILELLKDDRLRDKVGRRARKTAMRYRWKNCVKEIISTLKAV